jgi:DNA-binding MarR family transcriptional regulator
MTLRQLWDDYVLDASVPYLMNRVVARMNRELEARLKPLGATFQHWRILAVLARDDGSSITHLARYAVVPHSSLSRLLSRMEAEGLVRRDGDEQDGRSVTVWVTPAGTALYRRMLPMAIDIRERALQGVATDEREALHRLLDRMMDNLQAG